MENNKFNNSYKKNILLSSPFERDPTRDFFFLLCKPQAIIVMMIATTTKPPITQSTIKPGLARKDHEITIMVLYG